MKSVTFDEAQAKFATLFDLAAAGEFIVIARDGQRVAVHSMPSANDPAVAPPAFFEQDYTLEEADELNTFAAHGPTAPLP